MVNIFSSDVAKPKSNCVRIGIFTYIKWSVFQMLERLSDLLGNNAASHFDIQFSSVALPSLWVFVSTIGELNAIDPLLKVLIQRLKNLKLILITDHVHYRESYKERYPNAEVCVTRGHSGDAIELSFIYPPQLLIVGEVPCWPSDAPCRFSFAFLLEAKRHGAFACIINGWLYHYSPSCRMDSIERKLFQQDYLCAFDVIAVQTDEVRTHLLNAGAPIERIGVTGNLKFDAISKLDWSPNQARSPIMLASLLEAKRPIIVAGCVTEYTEQNLLLDALMEVRVIYPEVLLVLAPRHPEFSERMQALSKILYKRQILSLFRSTVLDSKIPSEISCLVLDSIGELRDFYAVAHIAHVGRNHNVLEPLAFEKPVTVNSGWEVTYPSYPVYRMALDSKCVLEVETESGLGAQWIQLLDNPTTYVSHQILVRNMLTKAQGAIERHISLLNPYLEQLMY